MLQTLKLSSAGSYVSEAGSGSAVAPAVSDLSEGDDITLTCDAVTTGGQRPRLKWSKQVRCEKVISAVMKIPKFLSEQ